MNILPTARKNAAENMADDELLLNAYPQPDFPRFRHYKWTRTAYTFGYMQAFQRVLDCLPLPPQELIRRPTGGGVVDHRNDWTYALVIPQTHQIAKYAPLQIYLDLHTLLKKSLERCSQLKLHIFQPKRHSQEKNAFPLPLSSSASQCFQTPSPYDLLLPNGKKLAGAALKRNKNGVLVQGSIARSALSSLHNWKVFKTCFIENLAVYFKTSTQQVDFPQWNVKLCQETYQRYYSEQWNRKR